MLEICGFAFKSECTDALPTAKFINRGIYISGGCPEKFSTIATFNDYLY